MSFSYLSPLPARSSSPTPTIMNAEDKEAIRTKITETIEKLGEKIAELKELTKPIPPENAIGRVSRMDAINNKSVNEAALRQSEAKLSKLKLALGRIDDGDFGKCARCGQNIPTGRLMLLPESRMCVNCVGR